MRVRHSRHIPQGGPASFQDGAGVLLGLPFSESDRATRLQGHWGEKTRALESDRSLSSPSSAIFKLSGFGRFVIIFDPHSPQWEMGLLERL